MPMNFGLLNHFENMFMLERLTIVLMCSSSNSSEELRGFFFSVRGLLSLLLPISVGECACHRERERERAGWSGSWWCWQTSASMEELTLS